MIRWLKSKIRKRIDSIVAPHFEQFFSSSVQPLSSRVEELARVDPGVQILLSLKYKELLCSKAPMPTFADVGFRVFSGNDEDGILLFIFSLVGTANKRAIEICAEDGVHCNTGNLILNHGWSALLFDYNERALNHGRRFYATCPNTCYYPPKLVTAWIDAENIDSLIAQHGFAGEIDLLSLDLDGVDYWVWKAITCIRPRVIVLEYQDIWGPDKAVTVPYRRDFDRTTVHPDYFGVSLSAFVRLGRQKGYRLVGTNRYGFNAFFIRSGIAEDILPEIPPAACFNHPCEHWKIKEERVKRLSQVIEYEWVEV
jgi:hypothetical protein